MTREEVYERLTSVFEDVFEDDIALSDSTTAADVPGWDSISHITLLVCIEQEFGIKLPMKDVVHLRNVGDMVSLISQYVGA